MGYFDSDHLVDEKFSIGPRVGFFESVSQGYEQQYRVDSPYALEAEIADRWQKSLAMLEQTTGEVQSLPGGLGAYQYYARSIMGQDQGFWAKDFSGEVAPQMQEEIAAFARINDQIKKAGNPAIKSFEQVLEEAIAAQQGVEAETQSLGERGGVLSTLGQFIGAIGGSFSERDPINLSTLGLGVVGRSVAMRVASEMAIAAGVTTVTELGSVQQNRELAGLPERSAIWDIAAAAVGAGVLRGGFEVIGALVSRKLPGVNTFDFKDDQLAAMFGAAPDSPKARAGLEILDADAALRAASPYGDTQEGLLRFTGELQDVAKVLGGQADTAVARVLPEVPFEYIEKNADFQLVREQAPEVYGRMEQARAQLVQVEERIPRLEDDLQGPAIERALEAIDPDTAALVRSFEEDLANPQLTAKQRTDIERRVLQIVESIGPDLIRKTADDLTIQPRAELKSARASRKAANKRYKAAYREVEQEVEFIKRRERALKGAPAKPAATIFDYTPVLGDGMSHPVVAARAAAIEQAAEVTDETARRVVARPEPTEGEVPVPDDGLVDIGLEARVPADFRFPTENGNLSFREALDDLREDEALEEAMKVCSI